MNKSNITEQGIKIIGNFITLTKQVKHKPKKIVAKKFTTKLQIEKDKGYKDQGAESLHIIADGSIRDFIETCHPDFKKLYIENQLDITRFKTGAGGIEFTIKDSVHIKIEACSNGKRKYTIKQGKEKLVEIIS